MRQEDYQILEGKKESQERNNQVVTTETWSGGQISSILSSRPQQIIAKR